jgi:hypothetical protein
MVELVLPKLRTDLRLVYSVAQDIESRRLPPTPEWLMSAGF